MFLKALTRNLTKSLVQSNQAQRGLFVAYQRPMPQLYSQQVRTFWNSSTDQDKLNLDKAKKNAAAERVLKAKMEQAAAKKAKTNQEKAAESHEDFEKKLEDMLPEDKVNEQNKEEVAEEVEAKKEDPKEAEPEVVEEEETISAAELKTLKGLFQEQEDDMEKMQEDMLNLKVEHKELQKKDKDLIQKVRIELTRQVRENESTVTRYRKMIEDEKTFAISKFAKELLEVRDAIKMAQDNFDEEKMEKEEDLDTLKALFKSNLEGQQLTASVMDQCLQRFNIISYESVGEKFDPKLHEAVFTIPDQSKENDTVGAEISQGWKIGERILRAAKVGTIKH